MQVAPTLRFDPENWVDEYGDYLFRCALRYVQDRSLAEDLVQETFLAALRAYANFSGRSSPKTWMVGILKHKVMDYFRSTTRFTQLNDDTEDDEAVLGQGAGSGGSHYDPGLKAEQKAFWEFLEKGLSVLNPRTADAFVLREVEQFSSQDVCEKLKISEANLWVMLHRAKKQLRKHFRSDWLNSA